MDPNDLLLQGPHSCLELKPFLRQGYALLPVHGDGVTDDTLALQQAIDQAIDQGGGTILVPGNYRVSLIVDGSVTYPVTNPFRLLES